MKLRIGGDSLPRQQSENLGEMVLGGILSMRSYLLIWRSDSDITMLLMLFTVQVNSYHELSWKHMRRKES